MSDLARPAIELKSRRLVAENAVFNLYFDHVVGRDGLEVPAYLVVAPKARAEDLTTGVSVLPVVAGRLGLLRVYRHAIGGMTWEVPRGFIDAGESPVLAAMRELEEEVGLTVNEADLHSAGTITPEAGVLAARVSLFIAWNCTQERSFSPGEMGHEEFVWFSHEEALAMVCRSEIQDPSTSLLILRYGLDRDAAGSFEIAP